jgi:hypothetical protein
MAEKRTVPPTPPPQPEPVEPPYYEATHLLSVSPPGALPVYAHGPGDHVSPEDVEKFGWGPLVKVPEVFAGVLPPPPGALAGDEAAPGAPATNKEE